MERSWANSIVHICQSDLSRKYIRFLTVYVYSILKCQRLTLPSCSVDVESWPSGLEIKMRASALWEMYCSQTMARTLKHNASGHRSEENVTVYQARVSLGKLLYMLNMQKKERKKRNNYRNLTGIILKM